MDITKKIKRVLLEQNVTATAMAKRAGMTQPNISYKLNRNSYNVEDLLKISAALNCELEINFVLPTGEKI